MVTAAFALPGIAVDGKKGDKLVIASAFDSNNQPVYGMWIIDGDGEDAQAKFICEVFGEEEYRLLYEFFEPLSDGDIVL